MKTFNETFFQRNRALLLHALLTNIPESAKHIVCGAGGVPIYCVEFPVEYYETAKAFLSEKCQNITLTPHWHPRQNKKIPILEFNTLPIEEKGEGLELIKTCTLLQMGNKKPYKYCCISFL
jgi:hypothetical protein